ncbi:MAG: endonuclease Q family protein, partial [Candidatus Micrarchaeota archaeon]
MRIVTDLHIHSKYSRATSRDMGVGGISEWARVKGIGLVGTGDFTHPDYLEELKHSLKPLGNGLFEHSGIKFVLSTEVSNIFHKNGLKKIHQVILAPGFEVVEQINEILGKWGNLNADGRPTFGKMSAAELVEMVMGVSGDCLVIPAHVWTPWFGLFGANSGFDSVEECYEDMSKHIYALETGLSSDPAMNWRLSSLDRYTLLSNSDAHSPKKLGREANVFELKDLSYYELMDVIKNKRRDGFKMTYEFYPEEGKYHFDGHRNCGVRFSPGESKRHGNVCPVCRKQLTIGVMHRVDELSDRDNGFVPDGAVPFENIVPLDEVISRSIGKGTYSKAVAEVYWKLIRRFGDELTVLHAERGAIANDVGERVAEGIVRMREGKVRIIPGYDGVYG